MLGHQLRQNLVLGLDLLPQVSDALLVGGVVRSLLLLEGGRAVLEELLLPAVGKPWVASRAHHRASRLAHSPEDAASARRPSPPVSSASLTFSCALSFTLLGERLLHFELNRNKFFLEHAQNRSHRTDELSCLGRSEFAAEFASEQDAAVRAALIEAKTCLAYNRQLNNLSMQERRLRNQLAGYLDNSPGNAKSGECRPCRMWVRISMDQIKDGSAHLHLVRPGPSASHS